jgi:hypothetical protein
VFERAERSSRPPERFFGLALPKRVLSDQFSIDCPRRRVENEVRYAGCALSVCGRVGLFRSAKANAALDFDACAGSRIVSQAYGS